MPVALLTALHATTVVLWIGGVAFVTIIVFPMLLRMEDSLEKVMFFQGVESRFARHARIYAWLTGLTGGGLLYATGRHADLFSARGIGITVMLIVWLVYIVVLTFERRLFAILFKPDQSENTARIFARLSSFHWIVLGLSLLAVVIGVWEGHGGRL